jgi:serine protease Do
MDIEWQIYSMSQGKVVARVTTHGGFNMKPQKKEDYGRLIGEAFTDNVLRLAADERFRQLVTGGAPATAPPPTASLRFVPAVGTVPVGAAVKGVVSIFAGDGLGSGVLISPEGYILTNHHVAGDGGRVRIRWSDGVDTIGEVVRSDRRRDIAVVKTTPRAQALVIRHTPVQLGETVLAIGTPLDKELAGTLTRGIVSANRMLQGQSWIQSDVAVTHGNSGGPLLDEKGAIVGITAWGVEPNGASANLNFFIPIEDALTVLALTPQA